MPVDNFGRLDHKKIQRGSLKHFLRSITLYIHSIYIHFYRF